MPYHLAPLVIKDIAAFPMTPTGKIAKAELRQSAMADASRGRRPAEAIIQA